MAIGDYPQCTCATYTSGLRWCPLHGSTIGSTGTSTTFTQTFSTGARTRTFKTWPEAMAFAAGLRAGGGARKARVHRNTVFRPVWVVVWTPEYRAYNGATSVA